LLNLFVSRIFRQSGERLKRFLFWRHGWKLADRKKRARLLFLPNVKDEPRRSMARLVRQHEA
jgi:hypothetical protein